MPDNKPTKFLLAICLILIIVSSSFSQNQFELNSEWKCAPISNIKETGQTLSDPTYPLEGWQNATVPGTVLTTQLVNKQIPDPFYGMNNKKIPDIYNTGREYYTYWFVKDFEERYPINDNQVFLHFRGVNYSCDVFLNGKKVNASTHKGMFLRQAYNITTLLNKNGKNRLAVIVFPPDPVGNPNGGQGGDGTIAKSVSHQYVAGWDWIQPIRDRNTGIWDKVTIERTRSVNLKNPHIITMVPGKRDPEAKSQAPAIIKVSAELENASDVKVTGTLEYIINNDKVSQNVVVEPQKTITVSLPDYTLQNPKLWWPHGYGKQSLYKTKVQFIRSDKILTDSETVSIGVREITTDWNTTTASKQISVNGQKIFIKGGNWIISDAMLRFSQERYDAEIRFHRDMNLNLIRIWGGALVERPEFYKACDKYGLLVIQDFWVSGDCNGRWVDPMKKEDQWTRRKYPDDHNLFLTSAVDMVKMVRNYPSLAIWCGGNEITPPEDILVPLKDTLLSTLDGTRWFIDYSNSDSMSYNSIGGNGDGPYGIQPLSTFWQDRTFPFNSEIGSVGTGDYESLKRFIPKENMVPPVWEASNKKMPLQFSEKVDSVWDYHKYKGVGYNQYIQPYGTPKDVKDFALKAQLVNYDQYRGLMEGFSAHMWEWYTGVIIWKTQNPWTAMRGQMYDYYLDPNACLYGLRSGSESLHAMCNPIDGMVMIVNNGFKPYRNLMLVIKTYDMSGKDSLITQVFSNIEPTSFKRILSIKKTTDALSAKEGLFLSVQLLDENKNILSDNFYWLPDGKGNYSGLNNLKPSSLTTKAKKIGPGKVEVTLANPDKYPVAFFNRIALTDKTTKERVLPVFYSDNYISILPGAEKKIVLDYPEGTAKNIMVNICGWNVSNQYITIEDL